MIEIFKWDMDFVTGEEQIDEQHLHLIRMINDGVQTYINMNSVDPAQIHGLRDNLDEYVTNHFNTEEKMMDDYCIHELHVLEHKNAHSVFAGKVKSFFEVEHDTVTPGYMHEILEYLIRWLAYHILNMDKSLFRQIEEVKKGSTPLEAYQLETSHVEKTTEPLLKALKALFYLVSEKNKALETANDQLEHRVRQRTSELEEANRKLEAISMTDSLTGLPNRRYVEYVIDQLVETWRRYGDIFSVMFIDVDKFKSVNDQFGHEFGDGILRWVGGFLRQNLRKSDIVCRLGGDEFVVVCPKSTCEGSVRAATALMGKLKGQTYDEAQGLWTPSISIGIADVGAARDSRDKILAGADWAMYESKKKGGNRIDKVRADSTEE